MFTLLRHWRNRRGTSSLEFALMLPLIMLFFIGIIQYSFYFFMNQTLQTFVTYATRSAVILAQANAGTNMFSSTMPGKQITNFGTLLQVTPFLDPGSLQLYIYQKTTNGVTTITATASYPWTLPLPQTPLNITQSSTFSFAG